MKLPKNQNLKSSGSFRIEGMKRVFFCLALLIPLGLFNACSSDDDEPEKPKDPTIPHSVTVSEGNQNMPSGGKITSEFSDSPSGSDVSKIVDNNPATKFVTSHTKFYILWEGNKTAAINSYALTSASDAPEKDPKSWTLSASNDKKEWTVLDTQTGQTFANRQEKKEYKFVNKDQYKHYKLDILGNNGDVQTQVAEWSLQVWIDPLEPYSVTIPESTLNMPSGGVITSQYSDFPSGSDIGKIADNSVYTKFVTGHSEFYILWEGTKEAAVNYYTLTSADDSPEMDPKSWTLSASDDGESWTVIDTQTDQVFDERREMKPYELENKTAYKYYKLDIKANNGNASTQIAEWTMEEVPTDIEDLMVYAEGYSNSDKTPMGNHYANRHITNDQDRAWLKAAENEPPIPGSAPQGLSLIDFNVNLYPFGTPSPADINQHSIGDCSALAVFASMAYIYPDFVKSLIKDNGDKTYTVAMFDPQGRPVEVTVTSKFMADGNGNIQALSGKNNTATWGTILEKAIMKWNCIYKVNTDIGGIGSEHVAPLFNGNGNSFAFYPGKLDAKQMARVAKVCLTKGYIMVGGFNTPDLPVDGTRTVTGHAWTIMHSTDKRALFTMRNPWGGNYDAPAERDGVINIPNNTTIPRTIDFRIMEPGIAANYGSGITTPYIQPKFSPYGNELRVADYILRQTMRR